MARRAPAARIILCIYAAAVVFSSIGTACFWFDEAIPLVDARLIAHGLTPFKDFFSFYPPLAYYLDSAAFLLFGQSVLAQRFVQIALYAAVLFVAYRMLRANFPASSHAVDYTVLLLAAAIGPNLLLPAWPGAALSLLSMLVFLTGPASIRHVTGAGILAALSLSCRINFGAYAAFCIAVPLALNGLQDRKPWRFAAAFAFSFSAASAALGLFLYGRNIGLAFEQAAVIPAQEHAGLRFIELHSSAGLYLAVMFPCLWFCIRLLQHNESLPAKAAIPLLAAFGVAAGARALHAHPAVAYVVVLGELAFVLLLHLFVFRLELPELCLCLFFTCNLHYFLSRAADTHWEMLVCIALLLFPYLTVARGTAVLLCAALIIVLLTLPAFRLDSYSIASGVRLLFHGGILRRIPDYEHIQGSPAAWQPVYADRDEVLAVGYVRDRTSPEDPVFVGEATHYTASTNTVSAYWLLDRPIGVFNYVFSPSLTPRPDIQQGIVADLLRSNTRWCLIVDRVAVDPAFARGTHPQSHLLDEFLETQFHQAAQFGMYAVLSKNTAPVSQR